MKRHLIALCLLVPSLSHAGLISGDQVVFDLNVAAPNTGSAPITATVGAGVDATLGSFNIDFNSGSADDIFNWTAVVQNVSFGPNFSLLLDSLDFVGGVTLQGFQILSTSVSGLTVDAITPNSVSLSWNFQSAAPQGIVISGRYITSQVPAVGPLGLIGLGLTALGIARRKRSAQTPT